MEIPAEPGMLVIGGPAVGDRIKLPPELGGTELPIVALETVKCPKCGNDHPNTRILADGYICIECPVINQFVWCRKRA